METPNERQRPARAGDAIIRILLWSTWAALTIAMVVYVKTNTRNVPYWDEFAMVPVMTGVQTPDLEWAWSQHNEHRPVLSRLVMAGLFRVVGRDFRVARYANIVLFATMAAVMLILARRLRGSSRLTDLVLPIAILNPAQAECLVNGFAMNLLLSSAIAIGLIAAIARRYRTTTAAGLAMVALPLCGGSGLAMLPPLGLWLAGDLAFGWGSGERPGRRERIVGSAIIATGAILTVLYFRGLARPDYLATATIREIAASVVMCLSLAFHPRIQSYVWPVGVVVVAGMAATAALLVFAALRSPGERRRAFGLLAVLTSLAAVAAAVAIARAGLGADRIMSSRYVALTTPMLAVAYIAWQIYGGTLSRKIASIAMLAMIASALPSGLDFAGRYGVFIRDAERKIERRLLDRAPARTVMKLAYPDFQSDRELILRSYRMLGASGVGAFAGFEASPDDLASAGEVGYLAAPASSGPAPDRDPHPRNSTDPPVGF